MLILDAVGIRLSGAVEAANLQKTQKLNSQFLNFFNLRTK